MMRKDALHLPATLDCTSTGTIRELEIHMRSSFSEHFGSLPLMGMYLEIHLTLLCFAHRPKMTICTGEPTLVIVLQAIERESRAREQSGDRGVYAAAMAGCRSRLTRSADGMRRESIAWIRVRGIKYCFRVVFHA